MGIAIHFMTRMSNHETFVGYLKLNATVTLSRVDWVKADCETEKRQKCPRMSRMSRILVGKLYPNLKEKCKSR